MSTGIDDTLLDLSSTRVEFLLSRRAMGCSARTLEYYTDETRWVVDFLTDQGVKQVTDITPSHLRQFLLHMGERRNAGGVHICHRVAKTFLRWVIAEYEPGGWANPIDKVQPPKLTREPLKPLSLDDLHALLATCDKSFTGTRDKAIMLMLLDTGLRAFELLALTLQDVQADGSVMVRHGKGGKARVVFIGDRTRQELGRYLRFRGTEPGAAWVTNTRTPLTMNGLKTIIRRRADKAGIPRPGIHSFRRAFAVLSLKAGADLRTIQTLLGHSTIQVTERYLRLELEDLKAAHRKFGPVNGVFKKGGNHDS